MKQVIRSPARLEGSIAPPGDKSISHRAVLLNCIARGTAHVSNLCAGDDRDAILRCMRDLGCAITEHSACPVSQRDECFEVKGEGPGGLNEPDRPLDAGNSGTAARLVVGVLAAQPFFSVISGDASLRSRPMDRVVRPLTQMGARIMGRNGASLAPLAIHGGGLAGIDYRLPVSSAQVKSSLMIAALFADGQTTIEQPSLSRDHTERMVAAMGAEMKVDGLRITARRSSLSSIDVAVPGDISSAAFWLVAACCHPDARIRIEGVGINPTRAGVLDVLQSMGGRVRVENVQEEGGEPVADLVAETSDLKATEIGSDIVPRLVDELPALALAACFAEGTTVIRDAEELRVKESDRIAATVDGLAALGARIEERTDGMVIRGGSRLVGNETRSFGDHRIAMTMAIAGALAEGETVVDGAEAAGISYPDFWDALAGFSDPLRGAA